MNETFFYVSAIVAFLMSCAIGAQDVSNALGTSVGSSAITVRQAIWIAGICEFLGSLAGSDVVGTISGGILQVDLFTDMNLYAMIMASTMFGAFLWLALATWAGLPVSISRLPVAISRLPAAIGQLPWLLVAFPWP